MIKGRKLAVMIAAAVLMSTVPTTAFGAVITYNSSLFNESDKSDETSIKDLIESGKMKLEDIAEMGPGYAAAITEQIGAGLTEAIEEEETDYDGPVGRAIRRRSKPSRQNQFVSEKGPQLVELRALFRGS